MRALLAILARLPWKWIGAGIAVLALVVLLYKAPWAYYRGAHSRDAEVAAIKQDRDTYQANAATLRASVNKQNAAIDALITASKNSITAGAEALAKAQSDNRKQASTIVRLRKSANTPYAAGAPCTVSRTLSNVEGL